MSETSNNKLIFFGACFSNFLGNTKFQLALTKTNIRKKLSKISGFFIASTFLAW